MLVILLPNFQTVVWLLVPPRLNLMENNKCWWQSYSNRSEHWPPRTCHGAVVDCVQNRAEAKRSNWLKSSKAKLNDYNAEFYQ